MQILTPHPPAISPLGRGWMTAAGAAVLILGAVVAACLVASLYGVPLPSLQPGAPSLAKSLSHTIDAEGVDAAATRYRSLQQTGFAGFSENENATNDLGYTLLGRHQAAEAATIFRLNTESHPKSANAFDSLGEAQAAAGDVSGAIASYGTALQLDPNFRSSAIAYAKLTGIPRKPYRPLVLLHISAGLGAILFGFAALAFRKGARLHRVAGTVFFIAMLFMAGDAGYLAIVRNEPQNILAAFFTLYMVLTAWLAAKRREMKVDALNLIGLAVAWVITVAGISFGLKAANEQASLVPFIGFSLTALIATVTDLRVIVAGGITGGARIARHLWRMCAALFIAVSSFFLGQSQLVPQPIRDYNLEAIPPVVVVLALIYWLFRNFYDRRRARRGPAPAIVTAVA
jgi:uncharacterized membrane protein